MKVAIQRLHPAPDIAGKLERDGWHVESTDDGLLMADHPHASSEPLARMRLQHLGLLTSGRLRIHFDRCATLSAEGDLAHSHLG